MPGRMAPSRYPQTATCGTLQGLRMCIQHHQTSSNYPTTCQSKPQETEISNSNVFCSCKLSIFTSRRDVSESTELMLDVSDSLSHSSLSNGIPSDINQHKSTNGRQVFRSTKINLVANQLLVATVSFTGSASGALEEKIRPCPDVKSVKVLTSNIL